MLFDALVGGTHLVNATAGELLQLIEEAPGLTTGELHARLVARVEASPEALPLAAVDEILQWLARLNIVAAHGA